VLLRPEWRAGESFEPAAAVRRALAQAPAGSPLAQALVFNFLEYLPNDLNVKMDRCSMAHGLETRSPFLDTAVIEYAFGLPDDFKLRGLRTKAILTQAFADLLPAAIRWRRKQGFGVPLDAWFRAELREPLEDLLLARDARLAAYLDADAVRGQCARHLRGEGNLGLALWSLLTLEVWLRLCERRMWTQPPAGAPGIAEGDVALRAAS
jgi:asparagine synthase (glutamine-hydrolysing)